MHVPTSPKDRIVVHAFLVHFIYNVWINITGVAVLHQHSIVVVYEGGVVVLEHSTLD